MSKDNTTIAKSAGTVGFAVMLSRILGLIREQVFAGFFGAGTANDAFVVAFRVPNLLRDLFGEGALSAAFVTVFSDYDQNKTRKQTWQLASIVLIFFGCALSIITLAAILYSDVIVGLLAPDFGLIAGKEELTILLTRIMMPFLVLISLSAVVMGILNTKNKFFIPALASSFFNLGSILGGVSLAVILPKWGVPAIVGMAIGTLIGGLLQLAVQIPALMKCGFRFYPHLNFRDPGLIRILKLMIPAVIGLSATQINIFINTNFAASCPEGSVSWLQYAFRLVQLPIGIFGVAIGIAAMPLLARYSANKNLDGLRETFVSSQIMVLCLTIPAAAGLFFLSEPVIRLVFERGAFTAYDTIATAQALSLYSIGLFAYSSNKVLVPVFYALGKTRYPVIASFITICTNILFITLTIEYFQHRAIALSVSITMFINFIFLGAILYRELQGYSIRYVGFAILKILFATSIMSLFVVLLRDLASSPLSGNLWQNSVSLFAIISVAVVLYSSLICLLKVDEFTQVVTKVRARFIKHH
ncbi:murein biosynthesis integral membrane protein MurJ [Desulfopila inferna]|uniref:murein biosynthesis integral membrane protein MurJ n=1 Tax=Desulfopila inferna TaxID=468528 RepID=UPI001964A50B|nr:murein biosynthesis integral membrane protein MurJ [Desulfopila inferna]MBM9602930.1 murein biosynthesis integral membrane protein MurJ [Desulfopila inferna]